MASEHTLILNWNPQLVPLLKQMSMARTHQIKALMHDKYEHDYMGLLIILVCSSGITTACLCVPVVQLTPSLLDQSTANWSFPAADMLDQPAQSCLSIISLKTCPHAEQCCLLNSA